MQNTALSDQLLEELVPVFLADLKHANRSKHTRHIDATDLVQWYDFYQKTV